MQKQKAKNNPAKAENKMNASQRLKAMESILAQHHQKFEVLADEVDKVSNLMLTLNKKINAILEAGDSGSINKSSVGDILLEKAVAELKKKVDDLVQFKAIEDAEDGLVADARHFIVARELDSESNVINPRTQFAVISLPQELQEKFVGKKVGDLIKNDDGKVAIEIMEVYKLADLNKEVKAEEPKAEAKEPKKESKKEKPSK